MRKMRSVDFANPEAHGRLAAEAAVFTMRLRVERRRKDIGSDV
jgi:hypothetical protein